MTFSLVPYDIFKSLKGKGFRKDNGVGKFDFLLWPCHDVREVLVPTLGTEPLTLHWKLRLVTTDCQGSPWMGNLNAHDSVLGFMATLTWWEGAETLRLAVEVSEYDAKGDEWRGGSWEGMGGWMWLEGCVSTSPTLLGLVSALSKNLTVQERGSSFLGLGDQKGRPSSWGTSENKGCL